MIYRQILQVELTCAQILYSFSLSSKTFPSEVNSPGKSLVFKAQLQVAHITGGSLAVLDKTFCVTLNKAL